MFKTRLVTFFIVLALSLALVGLALASDMVAKPTSPLENELLTTNVSNGTDTGSTPTYPEKSKPEEPQGIPIALQAGITGVSTDYAWSQTTDTYTEITGGTVLATVCDDAPSFDNNAIPFTFTYNGVAYTAVSVQCNGFVGMGASVLSSYTPLSSGSSNQVIAALGGDLQTGTTNSEIRYEVVGTAPDRIAVIQYKNFRHYGGSQTYNFQIRLHETTNIVEIVYGPYTEPSSYFYQIGLRGASNADFNNRKSSTGWTNTVQGTLNTDTVTSSSTYFPPDGLTWYWTPVAPHPIFITSYKTAPARVVVGDPIAYTVHIINSGTAEATAATMTDPIPAGTVYNNDVTCSAGTCSFNAGLGQVEWFGTVPVAGDISVSFSVGTAGVPCGVSIVNEATMFDQGLIGGPVLKSASTYPIAMLPNALDGFEVSVPPPGWTETIVNDPGTDPDWSQVTVGTSPAINPHSGTYMAKFNSYNAPNLASSRLWTGALDLTTYASPQVVFWMSHDTGYSSNADRIQIQVSTDGITWTDVGAPVLRYDASCTTACWKEHTVALHGYNLPVVYIGFLGISAFGNNFYLDDTALSESWYPCASLALGPDGAKTGCVGTTVNYDLSLLNNTPYSDLYDITASGNAWSTIPDPAQLILGPGGSGPVAVSVDLPATAGTDTATITAHGQSAGFSDTASLVTTAATAFWSPVASEPNNGRMDNVSAAFNGFAWSIAGYGANADVRYFDPVSNTWTVVAGSAAPFGSGHYPRSGCTIGNTVYMYGDATGTMTGLWSYNMETNLWTQLTPAGTPPAQTGIWAPAWVADTQTGYCYLTGGASAPGAGNLTTVNVYDPLTNAWLNPLPSFTSARDFHAAYIYTSPVSGNKLLCVAGGNNGTAMTSTQCYDFTLAAWNAENADMGTMPATGHGLWGVGYSDKLHLGTDHQLWVVGGVDGSGFAVSLTYYFDVNTGTWVDGGSLATSAVYRTSALTLNNEIYHLGGSVGGFVYTGLADKHTQCAPIANPDITVTPLDLDAIQPPDMQTTQQLQICNIGGMPLDWSILEVPGLQSVNPGTGANNPNGSSKTAPAGYVPSLTRSENKGILAGTVGLFKNVNPWASIAWENIMTANSIPYEIHTSAEFAALDFSQFGMIIVACDQNQAFYDDYAANALKFEAYVNAGGFLNFCAADNGWNGGSLSAPLPGGMLSLSIPELNNLIDDPAHPLVAGVPSPFYGNSASHEVFSNLPLNAHIITHGELSGSPTMVEYGIGAGWFVAYGQTLEITYDAGWQGGPIVPNAIQFGYGWGGLVDIPWLSEAPITGTLPGGNCQNVDVTFDSAGLAPGNYFGGLAINSNDPDTPQVNVSVAMTVTLGAIPIYDQSFKTAPLEVTEGNPIHYTVVISNTGTAPGLQTTMTDLVPAGTTYVPGSVSCNSGDCWFDQGTNTVNWAGQVDAGGAAGAACTLPRSANDDLAVAPTGIVAMGTEAQGTPKLPDTSSQGPTPEAAWPGPDGYGYFGSSTTFSWVDISTSGTQIAISGDDMASAALPVGFTFPFYGANYTDFYAETNGALSFGAPTTAYSNQCPLPNANTPDNIIPIVWDDMNFDADARAWYQTFATCPVGAATSCLVVEYFNIDTLGGTFAGTWEAVLYPDGNVTIQFLDAGAAAGASSTTGIEGNNAALDYGLTYACNTPGSLVSGTAINMGLPTGIFLQPDVIDAQGCGGAPQDHTLSATNFAGYDTTFNFTYTIIAGTGTCTGPASVPVPDGTTVPVVVTVNPTSAVGEIVTCEVFAVDAQNPAFNDTSLINKTVIAGLTEWQQITSEPNNGRMDNVSAAYAGKAWSIAGYGADANVRSYDPSTDTWTVVAGSAAPFGSAHYPRSGCTYGNTVYMYGDATGTMTGLWSYNMQTNTWTQLTPSGTPPAQTGIWAPAWVNDPATGYCYMTGGATTPGAGNLTTVNVYDPVGNAWLNPLPDFTTVRDFHAAFIYTSPVSGHKLLCVAGGNSGAAVTSSQCYDFTLAAWNTENADMGSLPATGHGLWGVGYSDKWHLDTQHQLWIVGGVDATGFAVSLTYYFDVDSGLWVDGGNLVSSAVYRTSAVTVDNDIYHIGGSIGGFSYTGLADHHVQISCAPTIMNPVVIEFDATADTCPGAVVNTATINDPAILAPVQVSASTNVVCLSEPDITVSPLSLAQTLLPNETATQQLHVCNIGQAPLDWNVVETPPLQRVNTILWDNGPLVTHPGGGAGGADASALQTALGLSTYGFGHQFTLGYWVADDFEVTSPAGWDLGSIKFFAYQTNSGLNPTITGVYYQILNGPPDAGGTVICGDMTTNRLTNTAWSNMYRVLDTDLLNTARPPMLDTASIAVGCEHLAPGTYWIMWSTSGTLASGPWAPPISIIGQTTTGNAKQSLDYGATWAELIDTGSLTAQGLPFIIEGTGGGFDLPWLSENPTSGTIAGGLCQDIAVTFNSAGLVPDIYTGGLAVNSNDPDTPTINVPVELTVIGQPEIVVNPALFNTTLLVDQIATLPMTITNAGIADLTWTLYDGSTVLNWSDNFDSYPTGTSLHGVGGWKGWGNAPAATAYTSAAQFITAPNSVAIEGASDLVHEYTGYTTGAWTYTAWQYIPSTFTGSTYFILLNSYDDAGANLNWSLEVQFNGTTNQVINDGPAGGTLPMLKGQWVEIRVEINLTADTQTVFYGGTQLFTGSWTGGMSGGGVLNIAAVDLFANSTSTVYYDDISLGHFADTPWLSENPTAGTTPGGSSSPIVVTFNATGLTPGVYESTIYAASNDPVNPLVAVPVTMTVIEPTADLSITKTAIPVDVKVGETITYTLDVMNLGPQTAENVVVVDTLPAEVTFVSATGCTEALGVVTCALGNLGSGSGAVITIVVAANAEGTAINTATVASDTLDPNLANNTATAQTPIFPATMFFYLPITYKNP